MTKINHAISSSSEQLATSQTVQSQTPANVRRHLMLLLVAVRKVTLRTIQEYEQQRVNSEDDPDNEHAAASAQLLHKYLADVPDSLLCLQREPFNSWMGLHAANNPLLMPHRLDGTPGAFVSAGNNRAMKVNSVLECPEDELQYMTEMSAVLFRVQQEDALLPKRPFGRGVGMHDLMGVVRKYVCVFVSVCVCVCIPLCLLFFLWLAHAAH